MTWYRASMIVGLLLGGYSLAQDGVNTVDCPTAEEAMLDPVPLPKKGPLHLRPMPEGFAPMLRNRIQAALTETDPAELAKIHLSEAKFTRHYSVRVEALRRWIEETLTPAEIAQLEVARNKTNSARQKTRVAANTGAKKPVPPHFQEDVMAGMAAAEAKDFTKAITLRQLSEKYGANEAQIRRWITQSFSPEDQQRWHAASQRSFRHRSKSTLHKPAPENFAPWILEHVERIEKGDVVDWFTASMIGPKWNTSLPTIRKWLKASLSDHDQKRFAAATEKARRARTAKAKTLRAPEDLRELILIRLEDAAEDMSIPLTSIDLAREFGVNRLKIINWLEETLTAEEFQNWKEMQFDLVARRSSERNSTPLPPAFHSALMENIKHFEAGKPHGPILHGALAEEYDVAEAVIQRWLNEQLSPEENQRYEAAAQKLRIQAIKEAKTIKVPEGFREHVLQHLGSAENGDDAPVTVQDLKKQFGIKSYQTIMKLLNQSLRPDEMTRWENATSAVLRRRASQNLRYGVKSYEFEGKHYDSKSEAAVSKLIERYIANWKPVEGKTLQISAYDGGRFDFAVDNTIVEYHPVILVSGTSQKMIGDLSDEESEQYRAEVAQAPDGEKTSVRARWKKHAQENYRAARLAKLKNTPNFKDYELVVIDDETELYHYLKSRGAPVPELKTFRAEFRALMSTF